MDKVKISKTMSYYLRHHPEELDLRLDTDGFTEIELEEFASRLNVKTDLIKKIVSEDKKTRFEIKDNRIRANYGHSIPVGRRMYEDTAPIPNEKLPVVLYHGTKQDNIKKILQEGLKPVNRQFVHLSISVETAMEVGNRRKGKTRVIEITTKKAIDIGVQFWKAGPNTIVSTTIPPECLNLVN